MIIKVIITNLLNADRKTEFLGVVKYVCPLFYSLSCVFFLKISLIFFQLFATSFGQNHDLAIRIHTWA